MTEPTEHERLDEMAERMDSLIRTNREFMEVIEGRNPYEFDHDYREALFP